MIDHFYSGIIPRFLSESQDDTSIPADCTYIAFIAIICSYLYQLIRRPLKVSCPCWTFHWSAINMALSLDIDRGPHCAPRDQPPRSNELHNELSSKYRKKLLKAHIKNAHKSLLRQDSQIYSTPFVKSRNLHVEPRYKWR